MLFWGAVLADTSVMPSLTPKTVNGRKYYYLRQCQRVNGKPKIVWQQYLGSAEELVRKLTSPQPTEVLCREFGASAALLDLANQLDLVGTIDRHAPKRSPQGVSVGQYLLIAALNRCIAPCSKTRLSTWFGKTVLPRLLAITPAVLSSQRFWNHMDRLQERQLQAIEAELTQRVVSRFAVDLRCLLFDATNFFTFVDSFNARATLPQRGKSKEGRTNLRLLGLALLVSADHHLPLFHHAYAGNQHDSITFGNVCEELAQRCRQLAAGACDITLVLDKGNNSEDNLNAVGRGPFHFVGSLVPTQHPDLLAIRREQMQRLSTQSLPAVWAYRTRKVVFGVERTVLVTYNHPLFEAQRKTLEREISKRRRALTELQTSLQHAQGQGRGKPPTLAGTAHKVEALLSARHMKELFATEISGGAAGIPKLFFRFKTAAWKNLCRTLLGKTILFTDRDDWSDEEIVLAYRSQAHVEAAFRQMKDPHFLAFRPIFHWTDQKLRVHASYCVLALLLLSLLQRKLEQAGVQLSIPRMIEKLVAIQEVDVLYPSPKNAPLRLKTVLSSVDNTQRALVRILALDRYRQK